MRLVVLWVPALVAWLALGGCSQDSIDSSVANVELFSLSYRPPGPARSATSITVDKAEGREPSFPVEVASKDRYLERALGLSRDGVNALVFLRNTTLFATYPRIGREGLFPLQIVAFQHLLREPNANAGFAYLIECDMPAGQLYGLCGLYFTDPGRFRNEVERLRDSRGEVFIIQETCGRIVEARELVVSDSPLSMGFPSPDSGIGSRTSPGEKTIPSVPDFEGIPVLDIAGGGYPRFLRTAHPSSASTELSASGA